MLPDLFLLPPDIWVPLSLMAATMVSFFVGHLTRPPRRQFVTREVEVEVVPQELARLAAALGITEDVPASQSYGRMIHDLFEAKDQERWDLEETYRAELSDLEDELTGVWGELTTLKAKDKQRKADLVQEAKDASARWKSYQTHFDTRGTIGEHPGWTHGTYVTDNVDETPGMPW